MSKILGQKIFNINQNALHYLRFTYLDKANFIEIEMLALEYHWIYG